MATYMIEIDDSKIEEQISNILNSILFRQLQRECSGTKGLVAEAAREIIYSRKDEIVEAVVKRASREIAKKSLPKFLERMGPDEPEV